MPDAVRVEIVPAAALPPAHRDAVVALCTRAYEEPFAGYLAPLPDPTHVLVWDGPVLASHACWVARTLTCDGRALRTAYVEAVATEPARQRRGHATRALRALADAIADPAAGFDLGVLSPSDERFYARLGWIPWRGPLAVATDAGVEPTPDEAIMVLPLAHAPPPDLARPLVAGWRPGEIW